MLVWMTVAMQAQSFDGPGDNKRFFSVSLHQPFGVGMEMYELTGYTRVFSLGYFVGFHYSPKYHLLVNLTHFFNNLEGGLLARFNTTNLLNLNEKINPHFTFLLGFRLAGFAGVTYMFSERVGLEINFAYPFYNFFSTSDMFDDDESILFKPLDIGFSRPYVFLSFVWNYQ